MGRLPDALTIALVIAATILVSIHALRAQERTPDPAMLLNLDLFTAQSGKADAGSSGDSMFQQIRALRAMGYLNATPQASPTASPASRIDGPPSQRNTAMPRKALDLGDGQ